MVLRRVELTTLSLSEAVVLIIYRNEVRAGWAQIRSAGAHLGCMWLLEALMARRRREAGRGREDAGMTLEDAGGRAESKGTRDTGTQRVHAETSPFQLCLPMGGPPPPPFEAVQKLKSLLQKQTPSCKLA